MHAGERDVEICGHPAARAGDPAFCDSPRDTITMGEPSVLINGRMAARMGDPTAHGGVITGGAHCVLIGRSAKGHCPKEAAKMRAAFIKGFFAPKSKTTATAQDAQGAGSAPTSSGNAVVDAAKKHFRAYKGNCSGFVRAVANELGSGEGMSGNADSQIDALRAGWQSITREEAISRAERGELVVAGLRSDEHSTTRSNGHVAVVSPGELYRGVYPRVWSGSIGGAAGRSEGDRSVGQIWRVDDRDRVQYFAPPARNAP